MKNNLEEATMKALQGILDENEYTNNVTKNINKQLVITDREKLQQTFIDLLTSNQI